MWTNIVESPLKEYDTIPNSWKRNVINYGALSEEDLKADGWRLIVQPEKVDTTTEKLGALIYDEESNVATYEVLSLSPFEIRAKKMTGAERITPGQGRLQLVAAGLLDAVLAAIPADEKDPINIYWEYAVIWERNSPYVLALASVIGLNEDQLDNFFIAASKIL